MRLLTLPVVTLTAALMLYVVSFVFWVHMVFYLRFIAGTATPFFWVAVREHGWIWVITLYFVVPTPILINSFILALRNQELGHRIVFSVLFATTVLLIVQNILTIFGLGI